MPESNEKILLDSIKGAETSGRLAGILETDPRLRALLGKLSPEDARRIGAVLSDKEQLERIMASPQARRIAGSIKPGGSDKKNSGN